jgi:hypothetical protein
VTNTRPRPPGAEKAVEAFVIVFGFLVGSGFDDFAKKDGWFWVPYAMGVSVVARFTLGCILHLRTEYVRETPPAEAKEAEALRRRLLLSVLFLMLYGLLMRISGTVPSSGKIEDLGQFLLFQFLVFAVSTLWGFVLPFLHHEDRKSVWQFWQFIDLMNCLALVAVWFIMSEGHPRLALVFGGLSYASLFVADVYVLARCADGIEQKDPCWITKVGQWMVGQAGWVRSVAATDTPPDPPPAPTASI